MNTPLLYRLKEIQKEDPKEYEELCKLLNNKNNMKYYTIWCEWDMPFYEAYATRELAEKDIEEADWQSVNMSLQEVQSMGLVRVEEIEVYEG